MVVLGAALAVVLIFLVAFPVPRHQGKTADEWIDQLNATDNYAEAMETVEALAAAAPRIAVYDPIAQIESLTPDEFLVKEALVAIGEPAIDPLIRLLKETKTGRFRQWLQDMWRRSPGWVQQRIPPPVRGKPDREALHLVYSSSGQDRAVR